jgi:hypothetical protein
MTMLDAVTGLLQRELVEAVIHELFLATDRKDWAAVERLFARQVRFDMSSAGGGPERTVTPDAIVAGWRTGLAAVEHVHHQTGNFVVHIDGDAARVFCYGIAYHYRSRRDGRNTRVFVGSYHFELGRLEDAWRIGAMRFNLKFIDGNHDLESAE